MTGKNGPSSKDERRRYTTEVNFTAFDRELIRCAKELKLVTIEMVTTDETFTCNICTVDKYFIEVFIENGARVWINKSLIARVEVPK